ncbi:MAG: amidophosphoribosyltransferase [Bacteroidales bacterium]|nr:amidophosphoribosyltransferase [Bacteroidales bacterium]
MGGLFGVVSKEKCITDLFYGVDYHSHLGTKRGGLAVINSDGMLKRSIHSLKQSYFRVKFEQDLPKFDGHMGIGVISDSEAQPIAVHSHLGRYAICTVMKISNIDSLAQDVLSEGKIFTELSDGSTNATELLAQLINHGDSFAQGIRYAQSKIEGSCTMLILTDDGIIAARDFYGRTPLVIGSKEGAWCVASESCSMINLGYDLERELGPGEAVVITPGGIKPLLPAEGRLHVCSFLWIYYGFPAASYEGVNVDQARRNLGRLMGEQDDIQADLVSPIPDSGNCMAIGYSEGARVPFRNAVLKYTPTWPRSFMPIDQTTRSLVAKMKLIPNYGLMKGKKLVFCDDSIVRGTQLRDNVEIFRRHGAGEVHIRISCPPLVYPCPYLNFSASKSPLEFVTRRTIEQLEGTHDKNLKEYATYGSPCYCKMVEAIRSNLKMNSLKFNSVDNVVKAIGLPKECICTHCFDGSGNN